MPERIDWLDDGSASGSPFSLRFGDRYRSELGGLSQASEVFLAGCGMPEAWRGLPQWCVLETGFGLGLNFLVAWHAWTADPERPRMLHFVSTEAYPASRADLQRSASAHPHLLPFARQLEAQWWGLLPGLHRLAFEGGQVLLTLCIGDAKAMLRRQKFEADAVYLDGFSPQKNPDIWDVHTLKAVARCCRRGTRIATWTVARQVRDALAQAGFVVTKMPGAAPKRDKLLGEYNPAWEPKRALRERAGAALFDNPDTGRPGVSPTRCIVIGAGLAGAAVAASLARRGWQVLVLDAAAAPASGASSLPAGLVAPHISPDDNPLSRLSRSGARMSLQQARTLLAPGRDWCQSGVLQRLVASSGAPQIANPLPGSWLRDWPEEAAQWFSAAEADRLALAGLPPDSKALWHPNGAWIRPASLVKAWLATPGVSWRGDSKVAQLSSSAGGWQVQGTQGQVLAEAPLVILATAHASAGLAQGLQARSANEMQQAALASAIRLQPIRGQVSWGLNSAQVRQGEQVDRGEAAPMAPPFPVNGHGSFIPALPAAHGSVWMAGASYERDCVTAPITSADHAENFARLQTLLPRQAAQLAGVFDPISGGIEGWAGVRCATAKRLPLLAQLAATAAGEVWISTGLGSRGLTLAHLSAELLAARLHGEPLPIEQRLAYALSG